MLAADDRAIREIKDALRIAERSGDDMAVAFAGVILGLALVHRRTDAEREHGRQLLTEIAEVFLRRQHNLSELRLVNMYVARELARREDHDAAIPLMVTALDQLIHEGQLLSWGIPATAVLVEALLDRRADGDVAQAESAIDRLADATGDDGIAVRDIWLLRMRALLARAEGDDVAYQSLAAEYRAMAESLGFEGHKAWATAMVDDR